MKNYIEQALKVIAERTKDEKDSKPIKIEITLKNGRKYLIKLDD